MIKRFESLLILALWVGTISANGFDHQHARWNDLLRRYVETDGAISRVDYTAIRKNQNILNQYLTELEAVSLEEYQNWSESERLAFLVNAYNAFTVKLIVDNYPVDSIKDLGGWLSTPWKKRFFSLFGEQKHLDNVEHDIIRKKFKEPRIHFAVNCASLGCPPLRQEAYVADRLDQQLEESTQVFLMDVRRNRYDPESRTRGIPGSLGVTSDKLGRRRRATLASPRGLGADPKGNRNSTERAAGCDHPSGCERLDGPRSV